MAKKVKWGILSTAKIGTHQVIPAMQEGDYSEIVGIASRNETNAMEWAEKLDIPKAYNSYDALLEDPDIEAIYNPLPNHMHVPWTIKSMVKGKHVLCEKPFALKSEEISPVITLRDRLNLKVGEAFMIRTHPQWIKALELIQSGTIGKLEIIHCVFSYYKDDPTNIRSKPEYGGGGLWDIGCYPIYASRLFFGKEPTRVSASITNHESYGVDKITSGILEFANGKAIFSCSTQLVPYQRIQFFGTKQMLEIKIPFNSPVDIPTEIHVHDGDKFEKNSEVIQIPICNQYTIQGDEFSKAIMNNTEVSATLENASNNTKVIEALFRSASTGRWETI